MQNVNVLLDQRTSTHASWKATQNAPIPGSSTLSHISVGSILSAGDIYIWTLLLLYILYDSFLMVPGFVLIS